MVNVENMGNIYLLWIYVIHFFMLAWFSIREFKNANKWMAITYILGIGMILQLIKDARDVDTFLRGETIFWVVSCGVLCLLQVYHCIKMHKAVIISRKMAKENPSLREDLKKNKAKVIESTILVFARLVCTILGIVALV